MLTPGIVFKDVLYVPNRKAPVTDDDDISIDDDGVLTNTFAYLKAFTHAVENVAIFTVTGDYTPTPPWSSSPRGTCTGLSGVVKGSGVAIVVSVRSR